MYVYLKDYRELEGYNYIGANQKNNIPSPFFLQIMSFLEKFAKEIKRVKINNKECVMHIPSQELMQRVNNVVLKFTPISNPNTTYTLSYKDLKPPKQKSQISLVFGMNALVPLGTI